MKPLMDRVSSKVPIDIPEDKIQEKYVQWYQDIATWSLNHLKAGRVKELFHYPTDEGTWFINTKVDTYPRMLRSLQSFFPSRVYEYGVDIGCGTTSFFEFLSVVNPLLIDLAVPYVEYMKSRGFNAVIGDIENLALPTASEDIIVCSDVLEHVLNLTQALSEISRIAKKGAVLCVNVPWKQEQLTKSLSTFEHLRSFGDGDIEFPGWRRLMNPDVIARPEYSWITTANIIYERL